MTFPRHDRDARPSLTPPAFDSALAQPVVASAAPIARADLVGPDDLPRGLDVPAPPRHGQGALVWVSGALVLIFVALVAYFLNFMGLGASVIGMVLALVPLVVVIIAVRIVDRWEPEPLSLVIFALAWGAIAAVGIALGVDYALTRVFGSSDSVLAGGLSAVVQAPIVEEAAKGLGLLLIFSFARRAFDGPVDGVVYGALVGAGFAFTENIQYFALSFLDGGVEQTGITFFLRGILSPFAHVMFTSVIGFALGIAARKGLHGTAALGPFLWGLAGAVALHAFWNGSAYFYDFYALYVILQVPLFVLFIVGILALRREEARLTRARLSEYAAAGWFTEQEVDMLATGSGRRAALAWAASLRGDRTATMKTFIADATALAAARQRALTGRDPHAPAEELRLLQRVARTRAAMFSL